jgi:short-subunit dehydrogenase
MNEARAMKIGIPGASAQAGTIVARVFHAVGDDVVVLSRRSARAAMARRRLRGQR